SPASAPWSCCHQQSTPTIKPGAVFVVAKYFCGSIEIVNRRGQRRKSITYYFTRQFPFFCSTNGHKEPNGDAVPNLIQRRLLQCLIPFAPRIYSAREEENGEGHEMANYGSRTLVAFCVPTVYRRAFNPRSRHGLLAGRRFR